MLPENMLHKAVEAESEDCKVDEISIKEDGFWRPLEPPVFQESCVIDEPGEFRIRLSNGYVAFYRYYIRTWDAEEGFGYIETEGPWDAIQEPYYWDEERWKLENRELLTTTNGIDAIILPLLCDVKNKKNPANYVCVLSTWFRKHVFYSIHSTFCFLPLRYFTDRTLFVYLNSVSKCKWAMKTQITSSIFKWIVVRVCCGSNLERRWQ